jgi:hypothetical protein
MPENVTAEFEGKKVLFSELSADVRNEFTVKKVRVFDNEGNKG